MSRFVRFSFLTGFVLGVAQFILVLSSGSIVAGLFWGIVPAWFWATHIKLKQEQTVSQIEGIASYAVVMYGGVLALLGVLCIISSIVFVVADPEIIQAAMDQQPNYDDFSDEELESFTKILEVLPSIMPLITLAVCIQSVAYISYGLAVVRNYSR